MYTLLHVKEAHEIIYYGGTIKRFFCHMAATRIGGTSIMTSEHLRDLLFLCDSMKYKDIIFVCTSSISNQHHSIDRILCVLETTSVVNIIVMSLVPIYFAPNPKANFQQIQVYN